MWYTDLCLTTEVTFRRELRERERESNILLVILIHINFMLFQGQRLFWSTSWLPVQWLKYSSKKIEGIGKAAAILLGGNTHPFTRSHQALPPICLVVGPFAQNIVWVFFWGGHGKVPKIVGFVRRDLMLMRCDRVCSHFSYQIRTKGSLLFLKQIGYLGYLDPPKGNLQGARWCLVR